MLNDIFIDLKFEILDELIETLFCKEKVNENDEKQNFRNSNINSMDQNKIYSSSVDQKIKTHPFTIMHTRRIINNNSKLNPYKDPIYIVNQFKEKNSIFNIPGFMTNLEIKQNKKDENGDFNCYNNLDNLTNEDHFKIRIDESVTKINNNENQDKTIDYFKNNNLMNKSINKSKEYKKKDIINNNYKTNNIEIVKNNEFHTSQEKFKSEIINYNLSNKTKKKNNPKIEENHDNQENFDYYELSSSFDSTDTFKVKKFKKNLEKGNLFFGNSKHNKKTNTSNETNFSNNQDKRLKIYNDDIKFNSRPLPKIINQKKDDNVKLRGTTFNKKFLSYILKITNRDLEEKEKLNNNDNKYEFNYDIDNNLENINDGYGEEFKASTCMNNSSNYMRTSEYSQINTQNNLTPHHKIIKNPSNDIRSLYKAYLFSKKQNSPKLNVECSDIDNKLLKCINNNNLDFVQMNVNEIPSNKNCQKNINFYMDKNLKFSDNAIINERNYLDLDDKENSNFGLINKREYNKDNISEFEKNSVITNFQKIKEREYITSSNKKINNKNENDNFINNKTSLIKIQSNKKSNLDNCSKLKLISSSKKLKSENLLKSSKSIKIEEKFTNNKQVISPFSIYDNNIKLNKINLPNNNKIEEKEKKDIKNKLIEKYQGKLRKSIKKIDNQMRLMIDFMDKYKYASYSKLLDLKIFHGKKIL